jgi:phage terminase large subunit-like protein
MARRRKPFPASLGDVVAEWIEATCCHGPGDVYGEPVRLTTEEHAFLESAYAIDPETGRRLIDTAVYSRRKGTRKSELGAWLVCAEALGPTRAYLEDGEPVARPPHDPAIICAATTEDQGDLVYGAFRAIVKASAPLEAEFDVGLEVTYLTGRPGKVQLIQSRNAAALDGARPTFEVGDETHLWLPLLHETYATLRRNLRKRRQAQPWVFLPTTAYGKGQESIAELLHKAAGSRSGRRVVGRLLFDHRQAGTKWDLDDPTQLRLAIEEAGGDAHWSDTDSIAAELAEATSPVWEFRRYWLNQPSEPDEESWLPAGQWEANRRAGCEIDRTQPFEVAVDMALKHDTVAVRATQDARDGTIRTQAWSWVPNGAVVDVAAVEALLIDLHQSGNLTACGYDPAFFEASAQRLLDIGLPMEEFPQSNARMVPACQNAYELICGGLVVHDDEPVPAEQVVHAVPHATSEGWRLSKGRSRKKIDSSIALVMALWLTTLKPDGDAPLTPVVVFV